METYRADKQRILQRESACTWRNYGMTIPDEESLVNCLVKHLGRVKSLSEHLLSVAGLSLHRKQSFFVFT